MKQRGALFFYIISICLVYVQQAFSQAQVYNIKTFGAIDDGQTLNTVSIQAAIDSAYSRGGGIVLVPAGRFLSGSIFLKSGVELQLAEGATLLGSTNRFDYQKLTWHALVLAKGQHHIAITGRGCIDGQGAALAAHVVQLVKEGKIVDPYWGNNRPHERERPQLIELVQCRQVRVTGVLLKNSACWVQTYERCDGLVISDIRVESRAYWNNDGIDIVDSRNVQVRNCDINAADDGICLKSSFPPAFCDSILIENCRIRSSASALKFGTASKSGFRNVRVRGLRVADTYRSAVALEIVDGGSMENIEISDIQATNTGNAIFVRLGHRNQKGEIGTLRNIHLHDITVEVPTGRPDAGYAFEGPEVTAPHNLIPSSISGLPGHPVQQVRLENILIRFGGGGRPERAQVPLHALDSIPERPADYPEFSMFGELPAWGFYVRHVEGLEMKNIRLECREPDFRPALLFDDVQQLSLRNIRIGNGGGLPAVVLRNAPSTLLKKVRLGRQPAVVLKLE
ncbi:MAG: glycoside hydrolase family 28 [Saprospiraceae bacterium]|nr:glycoside hydrolase family 28 [Saprospiraceae bacterium]